MFAKLSLRGKILVFPSVAAAGFFSVLLVAWVLGARNTTLQNTIETGYAPALLLSVELEKTLLSIERGLQEAAVTEDADALSETDVLQRQFLSLVARARDNPVMDERELSAIDSDFEAYYRLARETTARVIAGNMEAEVMASMRQMNEQFNAIQNNLEASTRRDEQAMASAFALARRNLGKIFLCRHDGEGALHSSARHIVLVARPNDHAPHDATHDRGHANRERRHGDPGYRGQAHGRRRSDSRDRISPEADSGGKE
jgi:hypothetical protein